MTKQAHDIKDIRLKAWDWKHSEIQNIEGHRDPAGKDKKCFGCVWHRGLSENRY